MNPELTPERRATLRAVCDTVVPALDVSPDPYGLWGTSATALGVDQAAEQVLRGLDATQHAGMCALLDALAGERLETRSQPSREQALRNLALFGGAAAAAGVGALTTVILFLTYGGADPSSGSNPLWEALGYPGPRPVPHTPPQGPECYQPSLGEELTCDVVVVGSGAGGGVIAGELAAQGLDVVVLEAGADRPAASMDMLELPAYQSMYWRGGPTATAEGNLTLLAGRVLGGGTTVNWMNCLRTPPQVRDEWAAAGLKDVAEDFDVHLDAVSKRINVTDTCSDLNGVHERMLAGAEALGWRSARAARNVNPDRYSPETGGFIGFGDRSGAKNSTAATYLTDVVAHGGRLVTDCHVETVLVRDGAAYGVTARIADASGTGHEITVRASQVVVAAGALETPALLLRSGIGGPAVGHHLHLHPTLATIGRYGEDLRAWWGPPHALLVDEFEPAPDTDGFGFRIEGAQYAPGTIASSVEWRGAVAHKEVMADWREYGAFLGRVRDRGAGRVTLDAAGQAHVTYPLDDALDLDNLYRALAAVTQLHEAAGAAEISVLGAGAPQWRRGDDLPAYLDRLARQCLGAGGVKLFSAHQMGSARMGADPSESVADPSGQLHDTRGVWIGDASAFPTASGTNPMLSVLALAHRTARRIAATASDTTAKRTP
ncbi:GMC family oxidoreductase N-terminal domain-containing protein [Streptomyces fractus]|uniref:GMC family oxidoreductase N-terminal domain-containing protein n=1 Tax=Streptomyces fractus TaxID=641806 RepID=UPI003CE878E0